MNVKKIMLVMLVLCLSVAFSGQAGAASAVDYADPARWLALPTANDKNVDVFYLYPTAWQKADAKEPDICGIDNASMMKGSKMAYAKTATAFEPIGNVYAPYYRQADIGAVLTLPPEKQAAIIAGTPREDAFAAFDYYIKHYNQGRPFILASHSQGSNVMLYLLADYMKEHPEVYQRMIAAYVIGYSVTGEYLARNPHLKFAQGADDTGVIISYNTEAPGVSGNNPVLLPGAIAINPISWTREETLATAEESYGSLLLNEQQEWTAVAQYADARVDKTRGVVICSTADVEALSPGNAIFPKGVYHPYDYPFYYYNIRENAALRAAKFLGK
ncbi:DUF3089 domain-containing protein [Azotosporobacter soli]|uniref:DUF3089 domain-containing protein n=1 Tax=Azotosporobacter soli TaxID=3055040 RepID=UPI0031FEE17B